MVGRSLLSQLLRGGVGTIFVKIASAGLAFATTVTLARLLGTQSYGIYSYVIALISAVAIPAQLGLPHLVVRETAKAHVEKAWARMIGIWRWANFAAAFISLILMILVAVVAWSFKEQLTQEQVQTLGWGLLLVPTISLGNLRGAALRGLQRIIAGQVPEFVLRPGILILLAWSVVESGVILQLSAPSAMMLHVISAGLAFAIGAVLLYRFRPRQLLTASKVTYEHGAWLAATLPLALQAGVQLINRYVDILMLGAFHSAEDVAIYSVVVQAGALVSFGQQVVNAGFAPHFARLYASGQKAELQRLVSVGGLTSLAMAFPVTCTFLLWGGAILELVFGPEYQVGRLALAILSIGLLVNATIGQVAHLLNMTGFERVTAKGVAASAACNLVLNAILIPQFGMNGAALATASSIVLWNVLLWRAGRRLLGIRGLHFRFQA